MFSVTPNDIGIYIHWPFCLSKCPYCDFNSHVRDTIDQDAWCQALLAELSHYIPLTQERQVQSIFFGGGTPSLMPPQTVEAIIQKIYDEWSVSSDVEITLEANPTSIEAGAFSDFRAAGVNRVSIGVQSLRDDALKALGRQHTAEEAQDAIKIAAQIFDRYSFDLIYVREGQTIQEWEDELSKALPYARGHMSLYQLTIEPGTAFHTRFQRGDLTLPDDDLAAQFYDVTQSIMARAGLPAYEVSNHARLGQESRHNLIYWQYGSYLGIGPGAHGRLLSNGQRCATRTHLAPEIWLQRVRQNGHGTHPQEALSPRQQAEEWLMMGLRLNAGLTISSCQKVTGYAFEDLVDQKALKTLADEGYLQITGDHLDVLPKGRLCLNAILARIITVVCED